MGLYVIAGGTNSIVSVKCLNLVPDSLIFCLSHPSPCLQVEAKKANDIANLHTQISIRDDEIVDLRTQLEREREIVRTRNNELAAERRGREEAVRNRVADELRRQSGRVQRDHENDSDADEVMME